LRICLFFSKQENGKNEKIERKDPMLSPVSNEKIVTKKQTAFSKIFQTTVYTPTPKNPAPLLTYPRVLVVEHGREENGTLYVTSESLDRNDFLIHRSSDSGQTWKIVAAVSSDRQDLAANWQPFLYELPASLGAWKKGTLLLAGCEHSHTESRLTLWKSTNRGENWQKMSTVVEAGGIGAGVWEPFLILDPDSGSLVCFYSHDADEGHSQTLAFKTSLDGIHWSEQTWAVACTDRNLRPGMASVARLGDGRYFLCYEMVGMAGSPVHYKLSDCLTDWGDVSDTGKLILSTDGKSLGATPYCCWTPQGGEKGRLIVTGKFMASGSSSTGTDWLISSDFGESFEAVENPLPYTVSDSPRTAYSPSLFVAEDGSLYYTNDVDWDYGDSGFQTKLELVHLSIS
jgi:hypothetical protein